MPIEHYQLKYQAQIIKCLVATRRGYFQAIKEWSKHPQKFLGKPKIPKYKNKTQGRKILRGILSKVPNEISPGQIPLPFLIEKIVLIEIPEIVQTAINFIKANRFPYYSEYKWSGENGQDAHSTKLFAFMQRPVFSTPLLPYCLLPTAYSLK